MSRAALAQRVRGCGRVVEVTTAAEPARTRMVAWRSTQSVRKALAVYDRPRSRDRCAHALKCQARHTGEHGSIGRQAWRRELRQQERFLGVKGGERAQVVRLVQCAQR